MSKVVKKDVKKRTVKKRTFLGCATCRNRKVKCDGRRPTCLRCEKAHKECLGYGFKLIFIDPMTVGEDGSLGVVHIDTNIDDQSSKLTKRQQLTLMKFSPSCTYTTFNEVDRILEDLEIHELNGNYIHKGPFGIFGSEKFWRYKSRQTHKLEYESDKKETIGIKTEYVTQDPISHSMILSANSKIDQIEKRTVLPPIMSLIDPEIVVHGKPQNATGLTKILPLVPALELHHQRIKQQNQLDNMKKLPSYTSLVVKKDKESLNKDGIIPRPIWIHPRLEIDAILTYQTLVGSADALTNSWDLMKSVIFSEKYNTITHLKNRIIDKMNLSRPEIDQVLKQYINEVMRALNDGDQSTHSVTTFAALLRSQRVQELIRMFVKSQPSVLILSYSGCIFDTIVIPLLYKIVGELMVFECSVGLHSDWVGKVNENGIEFKEYCDILKRTYCMVTLSMTAFSQYKVLFNEYGIYDGSLSFFRCYIAFREMTQVNLSVLIKPLLEDPKAARFKVTNESLINRLLKVGLFKELLSTLILSIYQDSNVDIITNYSLLYGVLESLKSLYEKTKTNDKEINELWEWFRYLHIFYKSCSKIDLDNYEINDEGFEDVKSDYNLIKKFKFNDYFEKNEFNKIEIQPEIVPESDSSESDDNVFNRHDDDNDDYYDSYSYSENQLELKLPSRLAKRPDIVDRPPKSFTVHFHFSQSEKNEKSEHSEDSDSSYYSDSSDDDINQQNEKKESIIPSRMNYISEEFSTKVYREENSFDKANKINERTEKCAADEKSKDYKQEPEDKVKKDVNILTGLSTSQSTTMPLNDREQLFHNKGKVIIPHPSSPEWKTSPNRPSTIELSFGLPISLLKLLERSVRLADHKNWCLRKKIFPRNFPRICCDLEEDLINWKLDWDLYSDDRTNNEELKFHSLFHKALYHLSVSFYNTTLMFFFRLIKEIDPNLLQIHVESTITHLEQLRNLSLRSDFLKDMKLSPPFWCFFISGSDAKSPQLRYRFDEVARKTFVAANKWIGKQIMMEVWRADNEADDNEDFSENSWLDMIKDWEISGFN